MGTFLRHSVDRSRQQIVGFEWTEVLLISAYNLLQRMFARACVNV